MLNKKYFKEMDMKALRIMGYSTIGLSFRDVPNYTTNHNDMYQVIGWLTLQGCSVNLDFVRYATGEKLVRCLITKDDMVFESDAEEAPLAVVRGMIRAREFLQSSLRSE